MRPRHTFVVHAGIRNAFREVRVRCDIKGAVLERDENFPEFGEILSELETAREIAFAN